MKNDRPKLCEIENCNKEIRCRFRKKGKWVCRRHYDQLLRYRKILKDKPLLCEIVECEGRSTSRFGKEEIWLCYRHYMQKRNHKKILKRTRMDRNEILLFKNYAEIILYNKFQKEKGRTKIDLEDISLVKDLRWSLSEGYALAQDNFKRIRLHRLITKIDNQTMIDHRNGDKLDNRKQNLRICTYAQNAWNQRKLNKKNTSGFRGVSWDKIKEKWGASINKSGRHKFLGYFSEREDAAIAYKKASLKMFGEFSPYTN